MIRLTNVREPIILNPQHGETRINSAFSPFYDNSTEHWYKANKETQYADDDAVGSATDWILGENAVQAAAGAKSTYKTDIVNGKAVFRYDGGHFLQSLAFASEMAQPNTIYAVIKATDVALTRTIVEGIDANKRHAIYYDNANPGNLNFYAGNALGSTDTTHNSWIILCGVFNGASSALYKNNASIKTGNAGAHVLSGITLGAYLNGVNNIFIGDQAEIIICSGVHDATKRLQYHRYLSDEYSITLA